MDQVQAMAKGKPLDARDIQVSQICGFSRRIVQYVSTCLDCLLFGSLASILVASPHMVSSLLVSRSFSPPSSVDVPLSKNVCTNNYFPFLSKTLPGGDRFKERANPIPPISCPRGAEDMCRLDVESLASMRCTCVHGTEYCQVWDDEPTVASTVAMNLQRDTLVLHAKSMIEYHFPRSSPLLEVR